jgi:putative photosynthetic complex assembly protein
MGKPTMMVDPYPDPAHPLPKPILFGGAALAIATVAIIAGARDTGMGVTHNPAVQPVASRTLTFADAPDGSLDVVDADRHRTVARVAPDTGGFIRAALRGLGRNRLQHGDAEAAPFRLALDRDNQLWLEDLATGQIIDLRAFGPTNAAAFAAFLSADEAPR